MLVDGRLDNLGLENLNFDGIKCLDVTKAILPKDVKAFTQQQYNCPVFVGEAQAAAVQNVWHLWCCAGVLIVNCSIKISDNRQAAT